MEKDFFYTSSINVKGAYMTHTMKVIIYGLFIWLVPFLVSLVFYPFREINRTLFQSGMSVLLLICVTTASLLFSRERPTATVWGAIGIGMSWLGINLFLDGVIFVTGPMHMILSEYVSEIGVTYLIIPILTSIFLYEMHAEEGGETMKPNIGLVERVTRGILGLFIIGAAVYFRSWWGLAGGEVLLTAIFGWSPLYQLLSISTISKKEHRYVM